MPNGSQNDAQMDAKIDECSYFFEKGDNARNYLFYNRKRGSEHVQIKNKSIPNRWKIKARKNDAERSNNKLKGSQNGYRNLSKIVKRDQRGAKGSPKRRKRPDKNACQKRSRKNEEKLMPKGLGRRNARGHPKVPLWHFLALRGLS